ncbi:hypothetical protein EHM69_03025 [candidate division KSB1 bacterium]|nr:MAG: hypothetical protein EHM69_03025 [candidate division KSB1 bacterium]
MESTGSIRFVHGYPAALEELRNFPAGVEPDYILGLYGLLLSAGMHISYCEADVLSGHATQFLYAREHPECAWLAFVPPTDTLFRALDVTWKEVIPSGPSIAYSVLRDWIHEGRLALARFREPLLVFGFKQPNTEPQILTARLQARLAEQTISLADCERTYWRYPLDDGNVLVVMENAPRTMEKLTELVRTAARRAIRNWHTPDLAGCASGDEAYRRFAGDLADLDVDFCHQGFAPWTGRALWTQWTSRISLQQFFERNAPRFGGAERAALTKAAFHYGQCVDAWRHWSRFLGPTWNLDHHGFISSVPDDFLALWRNRECRSHAARCVDEARAWEEKAIQELTKIIR